MIISREEHEKYMESYCEFKKETKRLMNLIVNNHAKIGIHDPYDLDKYFPCKYV